MFDYLQQFNNLPASLREKVSSASAMAALSSLEEKYKTDLATVVMRVMVKNFPFSALPKVLNSENGLDQAPAAELSRELADKVFAGLEEYLGISPAAKSASGFDSDIDDVIKRSGIIFPSSETSKRFRHVIFTFVKGIRSKIDTRSILSRPVSEGGFELSVDKVDGIMNAAAGINVKSLEKPSEQGKPAASALQKIIDAEASKLAASVGGDNYDLKAAIAARSPKKEELHDVKPEPIKDIPVQPAVKPQIKKEEPKLLDDAPEEKLLEESLSPLPAVIAEKGKKVADIKPEIKNVKAEEEVKKPVEEAEKPVIESKPAPIDIPKIKEEKKNEAKPPVTADIPVAQKAAPAKVSVADLRGIASRNKIQDIKPAPRVMGPIDELRMLSIVNFRRLGATPGERVDKIISKIKLLEKDGYEKMVQGVSAWRMSPVNRLYLQIAKDALVGGVTLREAAEARGKIGKETYDMEEIEAIISLNNRLMF